VLVSFGDTAGPAATVQLSDVYWNWRSIVGTSMGSPEEFRALLSHVESAAWRPLIDSTFPLEDLDAAARRLASPSRHGKVVILVGAAPRR
jgi:NADPH:quinone reductase-like Zn-dependent oxidoreductase